MPVAKAEKSWPHRKELTKQYILKLNADILTLQEVHPNTFDEDFSFMYELGYDYLMEESANRYMRSAIFWRRDKLGFVQVFQKAHKCQIVQLAVENASSSCDSNPTLVPQKHVFVATCHLSVRDPRRRVRELMEVLRRTQKMAEQGGISMEKLALVLTGDFNTWPDIEDSPVRRFLLDNKLDTDFNAKFPVHEGRAECLVVSGMT